MQNIFEQSLEITKEGVACNFFVTKQAENMDCIHRRINSMLSGQIGRETKSQRDLRSNKYAEKLSLCFASIRS